MPPPASRRDVVCLDAATGEISVDAPVAGRRRARASIRRANFPAAASAIGPTATSERILYVTIGYQLVSLDAKTGMPDPALRHERHCRSEAERRPGLWTWMTADIGLHSAPTIAKDVVIIGAAHTAGNTPSVKNNAKGYVRGFDVKTGKRLWIFHTIPKKGEFGYDTWLKPGSGGRCRQCRRLGPDQRRRGTGPGLSGHRAAHRRPDGHLPRRQRPVRRKHRGGRHHDRQAQMALPDHPSRPVGL